MNEYWRPLEAAHCFLVKRGRQVDIRGLLHAFPGSICVLTDDMDAVRPIGIAEEPLDRIAGAISEDE